MILLAEGGSGLDGYLRNGFYLEREGGVRLTTGRVLRIEYPSLAICGEGV